ncbi:MAG: hypothetical protein ACLGI8_01865 [Acidimicrobiia bacterium]
MNLRRTMGGVAGAALGLSTFVVAAPALAAPAAPTAPVALNDNGPIYAHAEGSLLTVEVPAISPSLLPWTALDLARTVAEADSDADLDDEQDGAQRSAAVAGTTGDTALLDNPIEVQSTSASAPEDEAHRDVLIPVDAAPLLDLEVIRTSAEASWVSDAECVAADTPMSRGDQALADLAVLMPEEGQSLAELDTDDDDGAVDTEAETRLVPAGAEGFRAVQARTTSSVTSLNLFNNLGGEGSAIQADVVQSPDYTVQASGLPGGASVTGEQPVVNVSITGEPLITLDQRDETVEAAITDLVLADLIDLDSEEALLEDVLLDLGLPAELAAAFGDAEDAVVIEALASLQPIVRLSMPYEESIAADGTSASVSGALLRVEVLPPDPFPAGQLDPALEPLRDGINQFLAALGAEIENPLVQLDLAPFAAAVEAPAGGIDCGDGGEDPDNPLRELNKHASATEVTPGSTFDYSISVPNRGPCTITDLVVTDVVTGPGTVVGTEPEGTVDGNTVTWELGELAPGDTAELTVTVRVDDDAQDGDSFDDQVTAAGDCDGQPVEEDDRVDDIPKVVTDLTGPCDVRFSNKDASHEQVVPGQAFAYYVHAFNTGGEPCTDVTVTDTLDDRVTFVDCNRDCANEGQEVTWTLDELPSGASATFTVVVRVNEDATGTLENTAVIEPGNGAPTTVDTTGPVIGDTSIPKDPAPAQRGLPLVADSSQGPATQASTLPATGAGVATAAAALLAAAGIGLQALRRRVS